MQYLTIRNRIFEWGKSTYLMGILIITPDSFSDGGDIGVWKYLSANGNDFNQTNQTEKPILRINGLNCVYN